MRIEIDSHCSRFGPRRRCRPWAGKLPSVLNCTQVISCGEIGCLLADIANWLCAHLRSHRTPGLGRTFAVFLFIITYEMAEVTETCGRANFFHRQECCLKQFSCTPEAEKLNVSQRRHTNLLPEKMPQMGAGEMYASRNVCDLDLPPSAAL